MRRVGIPPRRAGMLARNRFSGDLGRMSTFCRCLASAPENGWLHRVDGAAPGPCPAPAARSAPPRSAAGFAPLRSTNSGEIGSTATLRRWDAPQPELVLRGGAGRICGAGWWRNGANEEWDRRAGVGPPTRIGNRDAVSCRAGWCPPRCRSRCARGCRCRRSAGSARTTCSSGTPPGRLSSPSARRHRGLRSAAAKPGPRR